MLMKCTICQIPKKAKKIKIKQTSVSKHYIQIHMWRNGCVLDNFQKKKNFIKKIYFVT